jgi:hypothetical protein
VNARTTAGDTPLFLAVRYQLNRMVELLLKHGANPSIANIQNETPLGYVDSQIRKSVGLPLPSAPGTLVRSNDSDMLKEIRELLIQHGADENYERRMQIAVAGFQTGLSDFSKGSEFVESIFFTGTFRGGLQNALLSASLDLTVSFSESCQGKNSSVGRKC